MRTDIRLTAQDIQVRQENALELYYSGIKTKQTRQIMTRNLKKFLVEACVELLEGSLEQRAQQFVDIARDDQQKASQLIWISILKLTGIVMESETISPSESQTVSTSLFSEDELFFGIGTFPRDVPMVAQIKDKDGVTLLEIPFEGEHIESLGKIESGDYYFSILNIGTVPVTVNALVTADPIVDEIEMLGNIAIAMLVGFFLLLVGFIVIIVGAIIWFLDRRKQKIDSKSDQPS